jgi:type IV fimbrial biogenesis protein FimT
MVANRRAGGFTMPELLAVVAITAILATVAAPSMTGLIASQRAKGAASDLFASLLRTRSEAIKRNTDVTLTPKAADSWASGWSIARPGAATLLEDRPAITGATITGPASVVYMPNGRIRGAAAVAFDIQVAGAAKRRCIAVDLSGRPYQQSSACPP